MLHKGSWTSGYRPVAKYLSRHLSTPDPRTSIQRADALAYETYLTSRLAALLDLSLYASAANWAATTRPAYSKVLHFPLTWTVPTTLRADAIRRVARFGFSELDADGRGDDDDEDEEEAPAFRWKGLLGRKRVVDAMSAEQMMGIRLYSFAKEVLEEVRSGVGKVVMTEAEGEEFGRTTWLLYACLALILVPDVPQAWLRTLLHSEFPDLVRVYEEIRDSAGAKAQAAVAPYEATALSTSRRFAHDVVAAVPVLGHVYTTEWRRLLSANALSLDGRSSALLSVVLALGPALAFGYRMWRGLAPFGAPSQAWYVDRLMNARGLARYGEIGSMLDLTMRSA